MAKARHGGDGTLEKMDDVFWEASTVIKVRKKDLLKWPDNEEALHQYRISLRVARSLVKFIKPYQAAAQNAELRGRLKELQDPTSRIRELDVLVPQLEGEPDAQALCREAQAAARAACIASVKTGKAQESLAQVTDSMRCIEWKKRVTKEGLGPDGLATRVDAMRRACESALATIDFDDQKAVHDLRKKAKALRYVTRELKGILPEGASDVSGQMHKVQDKLGEWCDARVSASLVAQICGDAGKKVADDFEARARDIMQELKDARAAG